MNEIKIKETPKKWVKKIEEDYKVLKVYIGSTLETEELYKLERELHQLQTKIIHEWLRITNTNKKHFWTIGLPTHLYDLLDSWDKSAGEIACIEFLNLRGYKIEKKQEGVQE